MAAQADLTAGTAAPSSGTLLAERPRQMTLLAAHVQPHTLGRRSADAPARDRGVLMPLNRRRLAYFVDVADAGQITRAARKLHIAQPALSQAITMLESE